MSVINQISSANTFSDWLISTQALIDHANYFSSNVELVISTNENVQNTNNSINSVANTIYIALESANTAANNANAASDRANTASNNANTAANNANTASNNANTAASNAQTASNDANTAASNAQTASNNANTAASNAQTASNNANTAAANANTANTNAWAAVNVTVQQVLAVVYPVGSIYTNATDGTNPATLLGFGTWTAFGAGRVPVGFNSSDTLFDTAEKTGGSKDSIVVSHTHTASTNTAGSHQHYVAAGTYGGASSGSLEANPNLTLKTGDGLGGNQNQYILQSTSITANQGLTSSNGAHSHSVTVSTEGSSGTNTNLPPYITVYMWKRTA
jgi:hypothetical protein